jgi:penicillin-binding protein 2
MESVDRRDLGRRVTALLVLFLLVLGGRLFHLQILSTERWEKQSRENRIRPERIKALRGLIKDRNGTLLATNRPAFAVAVLPYKVREHPDVLDRLGPVIGMTAAEIRERIKSEAPHPFEEVRLRRDVDMQTVSRIEERRLDLPGVVVLAEPVREYPFGDVGSHALGYIAEIGREELAARRETGYQPGDEVGRSGVERVYENVLRGKDGKRYVLEDAHGREHSELGEDPPAPGSVLVLTLDWRLQQIADSALATYSAGAVVALDPRDGAVLALASSPRFDPNLFAGGIAADEWRRLNTDPTHPLFNRAVQSAYPPGSTYKLVTAAAALEGGLISPSTMYRSCGGGYLYGGRVFHCWEEAGHGRLAVGGAIIHSCDVFFYQVGERMSLRQFSEASTRFGFGRKTGVDLPQEVKGLVPTAAYYDKKFGASKWTQGLLLNLAIGQGELLCTPLQICHFFGALGMRGIASTPHLLDRIETFEGRLVEAHRVRAERFDLSPTTWSVVRDALVDVVEHGTGRGSRLSGIPVAGKTGTAQNPHGLEHALFVAYAPADAPEIAVCVVLEQAGHGGTVAAPIARRLFEERLGAVVAMED